MNITAVWIVKNEAEHLQRSIDSMKAAIDDMIVVDTGSTDDTISVAEAAGARVVHFEWIDDFAAARNYGLEQATDADLIIFLDADEWFVPALGTEQRSFLEDLTKDTNWDALTIPMANIDPHKQTEHSVFFPARIYRNHRGIIYKSPIHEYPAKKNGSLTLRYTPELRLHHTGYEEKVGTTKKERNIRILERALKESENEEDHGVYHAYLLREYTGIDHVRCLEEIKWLLAHPADTAVVIRVMSTVAVTMVQQAMDITRHNPGLLSRRQVYDVMVKGFKTTLPRHPISPLLDLLYKSELDPDDSELIRLLEDAVKKADELEEKAARGYGETFYDTVVSRLYVRGADTLLRRGRREDAFTFVTKSLRINDDSISARGLLLLMRCLVGIPDADVIMFITKIMATQRPGNLQKMVKIMQLVDGTQVWFSYFMKKALEQGWAKDTDLYILLLLQGEFEQAAQMAWERREEGLPVAQTTVALACLCGGGAALYGQYKGQLEGYDNVLAALLEDKPVEELEVALFAVLYPALVYTAGYEAAEPLAELFEIDYPRDVFLEKSSSFLNAGRAELFLERNNYRPERDDLTAGHAMVELLLATGRYEEAVDILAAFVESDKVKPETFCFLEDIAQAADGAAMARAQRLYDEWRPAFSRWIDLRDVVNTEYVGWEDGKKERRALQILTESAFDTQVEKVQMERFMGQPKILYDVAVIYADQRAYTEAIACLVRQISLNEQPQRAYAKLAELFEKLNNHKLAEVMRGRAEG